MKVLTKKVLLALLVALTCACMLLGTTTLLTTKAEVVQATKAEFSVQNGASVKTVVGEYGIRFETRISEEFYNSVKDLNPTWGSILGGEVADGATLTKEAATATEQDPIMLYEEEITLTKAQDANGVYYYFFTEVPVELDGVPAEYLPQVLNSKINVRSFVEYDTNKIKYSYVGDDSDTYRSMAEVAEKVMVNDKVIYDVYNTEALLGAAQALKGYIVTDTGAALNGIVSEVVAYSEDFSATAEKKLTGVDVANGSYALAILDGATEKVTVESVTVADGVINLGAQFAFTGLTLGNDYTLSLTSGNTCYVQPFKYISAKISTDADFNAFLSCYNTNGTVKNGTFYNGESFTQRYYLLANDITVNPTTAGRGIFDVLDGNGHTVTLTNLSYYGLFGDITSGAVIKNIGIVTGNGVYTGAGNASGKYTQNGLFARYIRSGATVENVYFDVNVSVNATSTDIPVSVIAPSHNITLGTINKMYVNVADTVKAPTTANLYYGLMGNYSGNDDEKVKDLYFVSASDIKQIYFNGSESKAKFAKNESALGTTVSNADVYRYDTVAAMATAGVTKVGNWTVNADGTATWVAGTAFKPALPDGVKVEIVKSEYLVNSKEIAGEGDDEGRFFLEIPVDEIANDAAYTKVYFGETELTDAKIDLVNKKVILKDMGLSDMVLGDINEITLKDDSGNSFTQSFRFIHREISNTAEFTQLIKYYHNTAANNTGKYYDGANIIPRYYILTADITGVASDAGWNYKFYDVLDGNGHTVTFSEISQFGIFGQRVYGTIKNITLKTGNISLGNTNPNNYNRSTLLTGYVESGAVIDNVVIDIDGGLTTSTYAASTAYAGKRAAFSCFAYQTYDGAKVSNVYINVGEGMVETDVLAGGFIGGIVSDSAFSNIHVVTSTLTKLSYSYNLDNSSETKVLYAKNDTTEGTKSEADIYKYSTAADMLTAGVTKVGDWAINADGTATWAGVTPSAELLVGGSITYAGEEVVVKSSNSEVVEVSGNTITAKAVGKAAVSVNVDGEITIIYVEVKEMTAVISDTEFAVADGATEISLTVNGAEVYTMIKAIDNEFVSAYGNVITPKSAGTATITVAFQINGNVYTTDFEITIA